MGCLFSKPEKKDKYALVNQNNQENNLIHLLPTLQCSNKKVSQPNSNVFNFDEFSRVFQLNGIWNHLLFDQISNQQESVTGENIMDFLIKMNEDMAGVLFKLFSVNGLSIEKENLTILLHNLPYNIFIKQIQKEEAFLRASQVFEEEVWNNSYSGFEVSDKMESQMINDDDNDNISRNNKIQKKNTMIQVLQNLNSEEQEMPASNFQKDSSISLNDDMNHSNQASKNVVVEPDHIFKRINHSVIVSDYVKYVFQHSNVNTLEGFSKWISDKQLFRQYFSESLYLDVFFNKEIDPKYLYQPYDAYVWVKNKDNSYTKKEIKIRGRLLIVKPVESKVITKIYPLYDITMSHVPQSKYPLLTKTGLSVKATSTGLSDEYFFDTKEEFAALVNNYSINAINDKYKIGPKISDNIFQCSSQDKGSAISLKTIDLTLQKERKRQAIFIQKSISFKGVLQLLDIFETSQILQVVGEHIQVTLEQYCTKNKFVEEFMAQKVFKQLLVTTQYIHSLSLVLGALNPSDILLLLNKDLQINLLQVNNFAGAGYEIKGRSFWLLKASAIDELGFSKQLLAPEILKGEEYNSKADSYLLGAILYYMVGGCLKKPSSTGKFVEFEGDHWANISSGLKELIFHLTEENGQKRYTLGEALAHPWWKDSSVVNKAYRNKNILEEIL